MKTENRWKQTGKKAQLTKKELKKEFAKHLFEAAVSSPATIKAKTLCRGLAAALGDAMRLFVYCNISGNVKNVEKTWFVLDQRHGEPVALVNSLRARISAAIKVAAGGRTQQIISKTRQPERAAK